MIAQEAAKEAQIALQQSGAKQRHLGVVKGIEDKINKVLGDTPNLLAQAKAALLKGDFEGYRSKILELKQLVDHTKAELAGIDIGVQFQDVHNLILSHYAIADFLHGFDVVALKVQAGSNLESFLSGFDKGYKELHQKLIDAMDFANKNGILKKYHDFEEILDFAFKHLDDALVHDIFKAKVQQFLKVSLEGKKQLDLDTPYYSNEICVADSMKFTAERLANIKGRKDACLEILQMGNVVLKKVGPYAQLSRNQYFQMLGDEGDSMLYQYYDGVLGWVKSFWRHYQKKYTPKNNPEDTFMQFYGNQVIFRLIVPLQKLRDYFK